VYRQEEAGEAATWQPAATSQLSTSARRVHGRYIGTFYIHVGPQNEPPAENTIDRPPTSAGALIGPGRPAESYLGSSEDSAAHDQRFSECEQQSSCS
jgi:hypothetical protein